jgi:hypothetical protein
VCINCPLFFSRSDSHTFLEIIRTGSNLKSECERMRKEVAVDFVKVLWGITVNLLFLFIRKCRFMVLSHSKFRKYICMTSEMKFLRNLLRL